MGRFTLFQRKEPTPRSSHPPTHALSSLPKTLKHVYTKYIGKKKPIMASPSPTPDHCHHLEEEEDDRETDLIEIDGFPLNDGHNIPALGLGTWTAPPDAVRRAVCHALKAGYRHIDTAPSYDNENGVGQGIKDSGIRREDIFLTTKLHNRQHVDVPAGLERSLKELKTNYVDLYLMHWPAALEPHNRYKHLNNWDFVDTWMEMQKLLETDKVRSIGVSNFEISHLERIQKDPRFKIMPAVNQVELHPLYKSERLLEYCKDKGIHCTAYSPLSRNPQRPEFEAIKRIAVAENKTPAQILLQWGIQRGCSVIPKTIDLHRISENGAVDMTTLSRKQLAEIDGIEKKFGRHKILSDSFLPIRVFDMD